MWTRDGFAPGPATCTPGTASSWDGALVYISCLNGSSYLGFTDWRLPTVNEMVTIINLEQANLPQWLNGQGFINIQANKYWTSTTYLSFTGNAWIIEMAYGYVGSCSKTYSGVAWPVRK